MEDRIQKAVELFKSGYNCSQSVVAAFADMYGFTQEQALRMSASFGGGIGRMRETCGAACGMFLVAGLETGATEATDRQIPTLQLYLHKDLFVLPYSPSKDKTQLLIKRQIKKESHILLLLEDIH